ncbi:hypothetical protein LPTSP3_g01280 [Leptospira kobayashii]|uniref:DUF1553 domain-containing protein n=1 Tax=Leptospira kobayashii TaxID=1917830 RepID=A0ABN6K8T5_9LEPT|nr:DUF1553 domain-containing protein [Leptospira kobayashii]BDA77198.1 hypothetical protein LPTSP3_g01280 [Leptospira kobayashii]
MPYFKNNGKNLLPKILTISALLFSITYIVSVNTGASSSSHPLDVFYKKLSPKIKLAEDSVVLRRLALHLKGTIPSPAELGDFASSDPEARVINYSINYLRDPGFAEYWGMKFASLFRDKTKTRKAPTGAFYKYLADSLHSNKPYDVLVGEMMNSQGNLAENPATGFYIRDNADPLQVAEYVGRLFYAKRVGCARCHDHPFIKDFTRRDYYAVAAFFSQQFVQDWSFDSDKFKGQDVAYVPRELEEHLPTADLKTLQDKNNEWYRENWNKWTEEERKAYQKKHELKYVTLYNQPKLGLRFPHTDDAPGGDLVRPKFLDGTEPKLKPGEDRRKVFSNWLTDRKNDRFRKVIINRIWTELMGWSFFTPLDDWNADTKLQGEEILNHLDQVFVKQEYRIKDLILYIVSSDAYARSYPAPKDPDPEDSIRYFASQRLNPDQLLNSLIKASNTLSLSGIWERKIVPLDDLGNLESIDLSGMGTVRTPKDQPKDITTAIEVERPAPYHSFLAVFGSGSRTDIDDDFSEITIEQVLTLLNGRVTGKITWDFGGNDSFPKKKFDETKSMTKTMDHIYFTLLGRHMHKSEQDVLIKQLLKPDNVYDREILQDLSWAILNSQEFLHVN